LQVDSQPAADHSDVELRGGVVKDSELSPYNRTADRDQSVATLMLLQIKVLEHICRDSSDGTCFHLAVTGNQLIGNSQHLGMLSSRGIGRESSTKKSCAADSLKCWDSV
jgi:hypothetical protein